MNLIRFEGSSSALLFVHLYAISWQPIFSLLPKKVLNRWSHVVRNEVWSAKDNCSFNVVTQKNTRSKNFIVPVIADKALASCVVKHLANNLCVKACVVCLCTGKGVVVYKLCVEWICSFIKNHLFVRIFAIPEREQIPARDVRDSYKKLCCVYQPVHEVVYINHSVLNGDIHARFVWHWHGVTLGAPPESKAHLGFYNCSKKESRCQKNVQ